MSLMFSSRALAGLFAALWFVLPAHGQERIIGGGVFQAVSAPLSYPGMGNVKSGAKEFWGVRAYSSAQADGTHVALNVRAGSAENCDAVIATTGWIATVKNCSGSTTAGTAIATFCVTSTGCTVPKIYGQIGGFDATQATVANQATLNLNCQGGKPCLQGTGNVGYATAITSTANPAVSIVALITPSSAISSAQNIIGDVANTTQVYVTSSGTVMWANAGAPSGQGVTANTPNAVAAIFNDPTSFTSVNGSAVSQGFMGSTAFAANLWVMSDGNGGLNNNFDGNLFELALYPLAITTGSGAGDAHNICLNESSAWTLGLTC